MNLLNKYIVSFIGGAGIFVLTSEPFIFREGFNNFLHNRPFFEAVIPPINLSDHTPHRDYPTEIVKDSVFTESTTVSGNLSISVYDSMNVSDHVSVNDISI